MSEFVTAPALVRAIVAALAPLADPVRAQPMAACMRDQFALLGVAMPARRNAVRTIVRDAKRLVTYCVANAGDLDFFVRKAIGWALRRYACADAPAVRSFLEAEQRRLSPLSLREAGKHLSMTTKRESR